MVYESWFTNHGLRVMVYESWLKNHGLRVMVYEAEVNLSLRHQALHTAWSCWSWEPCQATQIAGAGAEPGKVSRVAHIWLIWLIAFRSFRKISPLNIRLHLVNLLQSCRESASVVHAKTTQLCMRTTTTRRRRRMMMMMTMTMTMMMMISPKVEAWW